MDDFNMEMEEYSLEARYQSQFLYDKYNKQVVFPAGISLETIFKAATFNNAKAFHLESMYGKIEVGNIANMLILNSNPLETVDAYNDIEKVIINGKVINRKELSAMN